MIVFALLGLLVSWLAGAAAVFAAWPGRHGAALKLALGAAVGLVLSSLGYYLALRLGTAGDYRRFIIDALLLAVLGVIAFRRNGVPDDWRGLMPLPRIRDRRSAVVITLFGAATAAVAIVAGLAAAVHGRFLRHGLQDAWHFWNTKARFMFRDPDRWTGLFDLPLPTHPGYPLMMPANLARAWGYAGVDAPGVAHLMMFAYAAATLAIVGAAVHLRRGAFMALAAAMAVVGLDIFWFAVFCGYADLPLVMCIAGATAAVLVADDRSRSGDIASATHEGDSAAPDTTDTTAVAGPLLVAGFLAAGAAWAKNEGIVFAVGLFAGVLTLWIVRANRQTNAAPSRAYMAAGVRMAIMLGAAAPVLIVLAAMKAQAPSAVDLVAYQSRSEILGKLFDAGRHATVIAEAGPGILLWDHAVVAVTALLAIVLPWRRGQRSIAIALLAVMALQLLAYYLTYVVTPYDVGWHVRNSLHRLLLHVWPATALVVFSTIEPPRWATSLHEGETIADAEPAA